MKLHMMCNRIQLDKVVELDVDNSVDDYTGIIADEVQKRVRVILANGKLTCEAHYYADRLQTDGYELYCVDVKMPNGVTILSVWVRHMLVEEGGDCIA